jgi:hypothetical protein
MKFDFYKSLVIVLLAFLAYGVFHLANVIEANESGKGRFAPMEHYVLDTKTGAMYNVLNTYNGVPSVKSNAIIK